MSPDLHCGCDRCRGRELKPLPSEPIKKDLPGQEQFDFEDDGFDGLDDEWFDDDEYDWGEDDEDHE